MRQCQSFFGATACGFGQDVLNDLSSVALLSSNRGGEEDVMHMSFNNLNPFNFLRLF